MARSGRKQAKATLALGVVGLIGRSAADSGSASATPAPTPLPPAEPTGVDGMCVVPGWEYAPRWSQADNGINLGTQQECADACAADVTCSGATWIEYAELKEQKNCWFKEWPGQGELAPYPCEPDPSTTNNKVFNALIKAPDCAAIQWLSGNPLTCDSEMALSPESALDEAVQGTFELGIVTADPSDDIVPAAEPDAAAAPPATDPLSGAPAQEPEVAVVDIGAAIVTPSELAALDPPYVAAAGKEFGPEQATPTGTPFADIEGLALTTAVECAQACTDTADCTMATWMGANPEWDHPQGLNCWLKNVGSVCAVPPEAEAQLNVYLLIKKPAECAEISGVDPIANGAVGIQPVDPGAAAVGPVAAVGADGVVVPGPDGVVVGVVDPALGPAVAPGADGTRDFTGFAPPPTAPAPGGVPEATDVPTTPLGVTPGGDTSASGDGQATGTSALETDGQSGAAASVRGAAFVAGGVAALAAFLA